jgi:hypothetical protein
VTGLPGKRDATPASTGLGTDSGEQAGRRLGLALFLVSAAQFTLQLDNR